MCAHNSLITINYALADGKVVQMDVTLDVAAALTESDRKMLALLKQDERHLDFAGYMEGQTEAALYHRQEDIADLYEKLEQHASLYRAIGKLTLIQQRRVKAHFFHDLSYRQIAKQEGTTFASVARSIKRAMKRLRKLVE